MRAYVTNKVLSFTGVILCVLTTFVVFGYSVQQWQAILLSIIIFGYAHFVLGFYHQLRSFKQHENAWQYYVTFSFLVLFSVGLAFVLFEYVSYLVALGIGFLYFLLHGLFNEQTLVLRQTGMKVPLLFFTALAIFIIGLLTYSIPDRSFFFDTMLQFQHITEFQIGYVFESYRVGLDSFSTIFWISTGLSLLLLFAAWRRYGFIKLTIFLFAVMTVTGLLVMRFGPPVYIYMYLLVVGYHFMTWLLFYLVEMKKRGERTYRLFLLENILLFVPLIYAAYQFFKPYPPDWVHVVFDYKTFVYVTYVHISTSFMNDVWMQRLQAKVFAKLTPPQPTPQEVLS